MEEEDEDEDEVEEKVKATGVEEEVVVEEVAVEEVAEAVDVWRVRAAVEQAAGGAEAVVGDEEEEGADRPWCEGKRLKSA